ncbi:hypothetical protein BDY24DRAFT_434545 [Mrakia frigida]|uniref:uncharacterized protein n=1 Tax=Mrakia frigida TaxID=29902 RepID=UPI003FCC25DD
MAAPPLPVALITGTPYTNRFQTPDVAPYPPKLPPHLNVQPFIRPASNYGPLDFPSPQPLHPSPQYHLHPPLPDHVPYQPSLPIQISVNQFLLDFQQVGGPPFLPVVWPVDITGRPPTARGRVHAAPHQQVGDVGVLVFTPIDTDEFAINIFNPFTGIFLGSIACRSSDHEFPQPHGQILCLLSLTSDSRYSEYIHLADISPFQPIAQISP